jgi:hypothetical protein
MIATPLWDIIMPHPDGEDMTPAKPGMDETTGIVVRFRSTRRLPEEVIDGTQRFQI